jgi:hypothetical protein
MARPVYLQQWTYLVTVGTAVECQNRTHALQQPTHGLRVIRLPYRRGCNVTGRNKSNLRGSKNIVASPDNPYGRKSKPVCVEREISAGGRARCAHIC